MADRDGYNYDANNPLCRLIDDVTSSITEMLYREFDEQTKDLDQPTAKLFREKFGSIVDAAMKEAIESGDILFTTEDQVAYLFKAVAFKLTHREYQDISKVVSKLEEIDCVKLFSRKTELPPHSDNETFDFDFDVTLPVDKSKM